MVSEYLALSEVLEKKQKIEEISVVNKHLYFFFDIKYCTNTRIKVKKKREEKRKKLVVFDFWNEQKMLDKSTFLFLI